MSRSQAHSPSPAVALSRRRAVSVALLLVLLAVPVVGFIASDFAAAGGLQLKRPWALALLLALPLVYWVSVRLETRRSAHLGFASTAPLSRLRPGLVARLVRLPIALRLLALALLTLALARPQTRDRGGAIEVQGIDMVVALDLSGSMRAQDLPPNRLEAAKRVLDDFISRRQSDRIGLVVFGKDAYTQCPLTLDYSVLRTMLAELELGLIDGSATAVGNALALSLARLRQSDAKSRVVILLTDGESNSGNVAPTEAARYARAMKVKVFTILMGPAGDKPVPIGRDVFGRPVMGAPTNPKLLNEIAQVSGGRAFNATDARSLRHNFEEILGELERSTRRDVGAVYREAYRPLLSWALALLLLEALLRLTRFREFP